MSKHKYKSDIGSKYLLSHTGETVHTVVKKHGSFYIKVLETDTNIISIEGTCSFKNPEIQSCFQHLIQLLSDEAKNQPKGTMIYKNIKMYVD